MSKNATLYYIYDPMCSWCWGYAPTWLKLQGELSKSGIKVVYRLGGLAPDSDEIMADDMQHFLEQTWHKIGAQLGTQFNFDFWKECQPRRSTYPSCRAALIARDAGLEQAMIEGIQHAYYLQAKNPSDLNTLIDIANAIGLDANQFTEQMLDKNLNQRLMDEIAVVRQLPAQGFPSLLLDKGLLDKGQLTPIVLDYQDWQPSFKAINSALS